MNERTLVLIKPDAVAKRLVGNIISDLSTLDLKMIGLKLVNVDKELAVKHYDGLLERKGEKIFMDSVKHIMGEIHGNEKVIAIVYKGDGVIEKVRKIVGETNPEKAHPTSIRGRYGRIIKDTDFFETVVHASDSRKSAEREIKLWFGEKELVG
ncbi:MAG TPA: nucleoside-diphosphate kinase [Candidatus Brocadiales bacterium]|nr:nucleoside-diphosphate kinase [Candidatus Brocadiales bacterium]